MIEGAGSVTLPDYQWDDGPHSMSDALWWAEYFRLVNRTSEEIERIANQVFAEWDSETEEPVNPDRLRYDPREGF